MPTIRMVIAMTDAIPRSAPPDKAAAIIKKMGHPDINPKLLRKWYKTGFIPGVDTGHKILLPIAPIISMLEGQSAPGVNAECRTLGSKICPKRGINLDT